MESPAAVWITVGWRTLSETLSLGSELFAGLWLLFMGLFSPVESGARSGCACCPLRKALGLLGCCLWMGVSNIKESGASEDKFGCPDPYCHSSTSQAACVLAGRNRLYAHLDSLQACSLCPLPLAPGFKADPCHYKSKLAGCWGAPSPGEREHRRGS